MLHEGVRHAAEQRGLGRSAPARSDDHRIGIDAFCDRKDRSRDASVALFHEWIGVDAGGAQTSNALFGRSMGLLMQSRLDDRGLVALVTAEAEP
jgi:hypothetical protein